MGAESFIHEIKARSAKEAFDKLIEEANIEYGISSYNGSINTCSMGKCAKRFDKFNKTNMEKAYEFINEKLNGDKWRADYIEIGTPYYIVTTVKKEKVDGESKELRMMYAVYKQVSFSSTEYTGKCFKTKTEADKYAMEQTLRTDNDYIVKKEYIPLDGKDCCVSKTYREVNEYKTKPKLKDLPNRKIEAVKQYIFYGWASC